MPIPAQSHMRLIEETIAAVLPTDAAARRAARERQDRLTKPQGSLGRLEELSIQLAGIMGSSLPAIHQKVVIVMAGDHGVVQEGVSAYPQAVTAQMVLNFIHGGAAINVLARQAGARLRVVDMGVASELPSHEGLSSRKVGRGTRNLARGAAMSRAEAVTSICTGITIAEEEMATGADLLAIGEMGIGNTTSAAAIASALTGAPAEIFAGRGTGIDDDGLRRKMEAIRMGLAANAPQAEDGLDVLAKLGGFEIGGLAGVVLGAAAGKRAIVIDGFISTAAAMIAVSLAPRVREYLVASHLSTEAGHRRMLEWLNLEPLFDLRLRLGEGTGAVLGMGFVQAACRLLAEMATFKEAGVSGRSN